MSRFGHGPTGGGGVIRRDPPPGGGGGYSPGGSGDRYQPDQTVAQLWPGYLEGGYFDADGNLKIEYVSRCIPGDEVRPEGQQHGVEPLIRAMANARPPRDGLTTGQLRRFFMHCRGLETRLKSGATWPQVRPQFEFIGAAAADAYGKQPDPKIPGIFFDFIRRNVAVVKTQDDFLKGFIPHFEALVGFGSLHIKKERN